MKKIRKFGPSLKSVLVAMAASALLPVSGLVPTAASAQEVMGSCLDFDLSIHVRSEQNPYGEGWNAIALYDGVPTFSDPAATQPAGTLNLGDVVQIIEDGDNVGVRSIGAPDTAISYTRRADLNCENRPLFSPVTRLERKAVVKVDTVRSDDTANRTVSAYRTPTLDDCDETCRKLSRFDLYFVMAETEDALLLSREVRVATSINSPMVGWISKDDVYEWPYSVGLRVREDYTFGDGYGTVCGYFTLEEAREAHPDMCQPILGGPSWFETSTRLLVMQQHPLVPGDTNPSEDGVIFETVAPISSRAESSVSVSDGMLTTADAAPADLAVDPTDLRGADVDSLLKNNRIDLFFLVDGTRSMLPYIDAIRGTQANEGLIQVMLNGFQREIASGVKFRAGFRVFRDTNNSDRVSIGEGLPLAEQDCPAMTDADSVANLQAFNQAISNVQVTNEVNDDYSEDLYGGLEQAIRDMRGCSDNRKLLLVITDAGYDAEMQRRRGVEVPDLDRMATRFNEEYPGGAIFFLRPPLNTQVSSQQYLDAYNDLESEASALLSRLSIVQEMASAGEDLKFFLQLQGAPDDGAAVVGVLRDTIISENVQPAIIDNLIIDIRGGASLQQAIQRLRAENQDIPGYFWRLVERGACDDLGEACMNATYQSVRSIFVVNDPAKIALDVWMDGEQLQSWDELLARATSVDLSVSEMRNAAVSAIDDAIRTVIREPAYEDENETFGEYLQRAGNLPIGFKTPLLGYSLADLIRPDRVTSCELLGLMTWLDASRQMLRITGRGSALPDYTASDQAPMCSDLTESGAKIRNPTGSIGERGLGAGTLRSSSAENTLAKPIYWIPQQYLP